MVSFYLKLFLSLLCIFLSAHSHARWSEKSDMDTEILSVEWIVSVNEDGSNKYIEKVDRRILTERGRSDFNVLMYKFDQTTSDLKVLKAVTTVGDQAYPIAQDDIEVKPLASDPMGLTKCMQVMIPLQHVTVGAIVSTTIERTCQPQDIKNYFADSFDLTGDYIHKAHIHIDSKLPLKTSIVDTRDCLNVTTTTKDNHTTVDVTLKHPVLIGMIMEDQSHYIDPDLGLSISVSTEETYNRIAAHYTKRYQEVCAQPLPEKLAKIAEKAKTSKSEEDQMEDAIAGLIQQIHYLGTWNSADGHYFPRDLETICNTGFGDCKEYSVCLVAILRALGYTADAAFVSRTNLNLSATIGVPLAALTDFNHVIVKAVGAAGKTFWLDPTNQVSMATGLFPDIADRSALVLHDAENPLETIPAIDPTHAMLMRNIEISFTESDRIRTEIALINKGESAIHSSVVLYHSPPEVIKEIIIEQSCPSSNPLNPEVLLPENNTCRVTDKTVNARFEEELSPIMTNLGPAFPLYSDWAGRLMGVKQTDIGSLDLGYPESILKKIVYKGRTLDNPKSLAFSLDTKWFKASRTFENTTTGVLITESFVNTVSTISATDLKSPEFQKAQATLRQFINVALILK